MNRGDVDSFLVDGCGRCEHYRTPSCKVHLWTEPLKALRALLLASELTEEMKWGSPCYTFDGKNVIMLVAFRDRCGLSFLKGALLTDEDGLLVQPGPSTQAGRELRFTSVEEVHAQREVARRFIAEAIRIEKEGRRVERDPSPEPMPEELQAALDADPTLKAAFEALTPGRQRSYVLHVSGAKQAATRASRAARCAPKILSGKGFNER